MIWSDLSPFCLRAISPLPPLEVGYTNIHYAVEIPSCGFQGIFNPKTDNSLSHCTPGLISLVEELNLAFEEEAQKRAQQKT